MAIPLIPAIGAAGAGYGLLKRLFGKKPEYKTPEYFGADYAQKVAALTQARQAQYGTGLTDIREALANSGMLNPAATVDATTRFGIAKGADIAGAQSDAYTAELDAKRASEIDKNKVTYAGDMAARSEQLGLVGQLAKYGGQIYASSKAKDNSGNTPDATKIAEQQLPDNQEYIEMSDGSFMPNPNYKNSTRRILKFLFGL